MGTNENERERERGRGGREAERERLSQCLIIVIRDGTKSRWEGMEIVSSSEVRDDSSNHLTRAEKAEQKKLSGTGQRNGKNVPDIDDPRTEWRNIVRTEGGRL